MVKLNGVEYEYRSGICLKEVVDTYNLTYAKVDFDTCVVIINSTAIPADLAQRWLLSDDENVIIIPKLEGG